MMDAPRLKALARLRQRLDLPLSLRRLMQGVVSGQQVLKGLQV